MTLRIQDRPLAPEPLHPTNSGGIGLDKSHLALKKATQQFEAYFMHELLKEMRKTIPDDKLLGDDGHGQEIFRDMMDQTLTDQMSQRGDMGIAKMMYDQLAPTLGNAKTPVQTPPELGVGGDPTAKTGSQK